MIEVVNLSKSYGRVLAVDQASFTVPDGAVTGFVGPNGAGKSTVLRAIAQLVMPNSGNVRIDGRETRGLDTSGLLGVYLSSEELPGRATARGVLRYVCDTRGMPHRDADELLEVVGLDQTATKRIRTFSVGMKQRLGLAVALLPRTRALMLDEPLNGLDPDGIHWIRHHLRQVAEHGTAVLLSSHVMSELSQMADRIVMLDRGRVVAEGTLAEFVAEREAERVLVEVSSVESARHALSAHGLAFTESGRALIVSGTTTPEVGRIVFEAGLDVLHLQTVSRSLEETYFGRLAKSGTQA